MKFFNRHPSREALSHWLNGEATHLDEHLATCETCATVIEELEVDQQPLLIAALATLFEPPAGLSDRLEQRVSERMENKILFEVASDLFGAGVQTAIMLTTSQSPDEPDRDPESRDSNDD